MARGKWRSPGVGTLDSRKPHPRTLCLGPRLEGDCWVCPMDAGPGARQCSPPPQPTAGATSPECMLAAGFILGGAAGGLF